MIARAGSGIPGAKLCRHSASVYKATRVALTAVYVCHAVLPPYLAYLLSANEVVQCYASRISLQWRRAVLTCFLEYARVHPDGVSLLQL